MTSSIIRRGGLSPRKEVEYRLEREREVLCRSLIQYAWLRALRAAIDRHIFKFGVDEEEATPAFVSIPETRQERRLVIGLNTDVMNDARRLKGELLGKRISGDEFLTYVEQVLKSELERYSVRLEKGSGVYSGTIIILPI